MGVAAILVMWPLSNIHVQVVLSKECSIWLQLVLWFLRKIYVWIWWWGPPRGFGEQGKQGIYFRGTGEQRSYFEGIRGTKTILGNREHKKTNFRFLGTSQFISGEQGNRYPPGRASMMAVKYEDNIWTQNKVINEVHKKHGNRWRSHKVWINMKITQRTEIDALNTKCGKTCQKVTQSMRKDGGHTKHRKRWR